MRMVFRTSWCNAHAATGSMTRKYDNAVEIHFDKFWWVLYIVQTAVIVRL